MGRFLPGGADGGAGGAAAAAAASKLAPRLQPLSRMLEAVLKEPEKLKYVRHDGFALLVEVLGVEYVRHIAEQVAPGTKAALQAEEDPPAAIKEAVREVARASLLSDGSPRFELWEEEGSTDVWLRLTDVEVQARAAACFLQKKNGSWDLGRGEGEPRTREEHEGSGLAGDAGGQVHEAGRHGRQPEARANDEETAALAAPLGPAALGSRAILPGWVSKQQAQLASGSWDDRSAGARRVRPGGRLADDPLTSLMGPWGGCIAWEPNSASAATALQSSRRPIAVTAGPVPAAAATPPVGHGEAEEEELEGEAQQAACVPGPGPAPGEPTRSSPLTAQGWLASAAAASSGPLEASGTREPAGQRMRGRLRAFRPDKGFGFLACGPPWGDIFVHANAFVGQHPDKCIGTPDTDPMGQEVEFTLDFRNADRPRATDAVVLDPVPQRACGSRGRELAGEAASEPLQPAGGADGGAGGACAGGAGGDGRGAAPAAAPPAAAASVGPGPSGLARAFEAAFQHSEELKYMRNDGFCLVAELLATPFARHAAEELFPGSVRGPNEEVPRELMGAVYEMVRASQLDTTGGPRFEIWDDWLQLVTPTVRPPEEAIEDGAAWWMGDASKSKGGPGVQAPVRGVPRRARGAPCPTALAQHPPLRRGAAQLCPGGGAKAALGARQPALAGPDPWMAQDPWSSTCRGADEETSGHSNGNAPGAKAAPSTRDAGNAAGDKPEADEGAGCGPSTTELRRRTRSGGPCAQLTSPLQDEDEDEERGDDAPSAEEILDFARRLPRDAPRGVREYLLAWSHAESKHGNNQRAKA